MEFTSTLSQMYLRDSGENQVISFYELRNMGMEIISTLKAESQFMKTEEKTERKENKYAKLNMN